MGREVVAALLVRRGAAAGLGLGLQARLLAARASRRGEAQLLLRPLRRPKRLKARHLEVVNVQLHVLDALDSRLDCRVALELGHAVAVPCLQVRVRLAQLARQHVRCLQLIDGVDHVLMHRHQLAVSLRLVVLDPARDCLVRVGDGDLIYFAARSVRL